MTKKYIVMYNNFDAIVNSYEEAERALTGHFGQWDSDYVLFEEYEEEE